MSEITGVVTQVIGPVVDISFEKSGTDLPKIHDALEIYKNKDEKLIVECQQHIDTRPSERALLFVNVKWLHHVLLRVHVISDGTGRAQVS